jgi:hypothetical protein
MAPRIIASKVVRIHSMHFDGPAGSSSGVCCKEILSPSACLPPADDFNNVSCPACSAANFRELPQQKRTRACRKREQKNDIDRAQPFTVFRG